MRHNRSLSVRGRDIEVRALGPSYYTALRRGRRGIHGWREFAC